MKGIRTFSARLILTAALMIGAGSLISGVGHIAAQEPGEPGFCHNNPRLCTTWEGDGCGGECNPEEGICCQPDN